MKQGAILSVSASFTSVLARHEPLDRLDFVLQAPFDIFQARHRRAILDVKKQ
jgi:hypothetical protein